MKDNGEDIPKNKQPEDRPADTAVVTNGEKADKEKKKEADQEIEIRQVPGDGICGGY